MASIVKRNGSYIIRVSHGRDVNGKQIMKTMTWRPNPEIHTTDKKIQKALNEAAVEFEKAVKSGHAVDGSKIKYSEFSIRWLDAVKNQLSAKSYERAEQSIRMILNENIGYLKLNEIRPEHLEALYNKMLSGIDVRLKGGKKVTRKYACASIKRVHMVLSSSLSYAVKNDYIDRNPCERTTLPKDYAPERIKYFNLEQAQAFLDYMDVPYTRERGFITESEQHADGTPLQLKAFFYMALYGGFRKGELLALSWDDIDAINHSISISKSATSVGGQRIVKMPKNKKSIRTVYLPEVCFSLLKDWHLEQKRIQLAHGSKWIGNDENLVFINEHNGLPMGEYVPTNAFTAIIKRYNKSHDVKLPDTVTLHGLRHTAATLLISNNVDIKAVSNVLGHSETSTTMNIYAHALETKVREAANVMDNVLARPERRKAI